MKNQTQLFLTSNIGGIKKEKGLLFPFPLSNQNNFLTNLKKSLKEKQKFVLIASNPENYQGNDKMLQLDKKAFELSGLKFEKYELIDYRHRQNINKILNQTSLIFLAGGNTHQQNKFFQEINLYSKLSKINCPIVGISAGAMNCGEIAVNSSEKTKNDALPLLLQGLGLSNYTIIPHFEKKKNKPEEFQLLLEASQSIKIYALYDGSYIRNDTVYGECDLIYQGKITKICEDGEIFLLQA